MDFLYCEGFAEEVAGTEDECGELEVTVRAGAFEFGHGEDLPEEFSREAECGGGRREGREPGGADVVAEVDRSGGEPWGRGSTQAGRDVVEGHLVVAPADVWGGLEDFDDFGGFFGDEGIVGVEEADDVAAAEGKASVEGGALSGVALEVSDDAVVVLLDDLA